MYVGSLYLCIYDCAGSSLLCEGFLSLQRMGATLASSHGLPIALTCLVVEHRL